MLGSYVCRQCRTRLAPRHVPSRIPQWQPRATFISLRNPQTRNDADQTEAQTQQAEADPTSENNQEAHYKLLDRTQIGRRGGNNESQRVGRYSKYVRNPTEDTETMIDVSQLDEVAKAENDDDVSYAPRIIGLLSRGKVDKAWALFERTYTSAGCEALTNPSTSDIRLISNGRLFGNLMNAVVAAFCQGQGEPTITPTTVLFKYEQLGIASPGLWIKEALETLTHQTILATSGGSETLQRDVPSLLFELLSVWRLFFQCKGPNSDPLEAISPNWNLPAVEAMPLVHESTDFNYRLQVFHPKALGSPVLGFCAI